MQRTVAPAVWLAFIPMLAVAGEQPIVAPETIVTATRFPEAEPKPAANVTVISAAQIAASRRSSGNGGARPTLIRPPGHAEGA